MFILQETHIDTTALKNQFQDPANGALVSFEGIVRADKSQGRVVQSLQYIADQPACAAEGMKIIQEALTKFAVHQAVCVQRVGHLKVTECAVWIGVWAPHRDEAFKACRYTIEEIKKRLLIWKKEFFTDGTSTWVQGAQTSSS
jgi:adenylyltransferase/sulfurtransferase